MRSLSLESEFQTEVIADLQDMFPGCVITRGNSMYQPGVPDLFCLLDGGGWIALECKKSRTAKKQPNQDYFVEKMNNMSFAAFIFPENKDMILRAIQSTFQARGHARLSERK